jgi:hypothetical protein
MTHLRRSTWGRSGRAVARRPVAVRVPSCAHGGLVRELRCDTGKGGLGFCSGRARHAGTFSEAAGNTNANALSTRKESHDDGGGDFVCCRAWRTSRPRGDLLDRNGLKPVTLRSPSAARKVQADVRWKSHGGHEDEKAAVAEGCLRCRSWCTEGRRDAATTGVVEGSR